MNDLYTSQENNTEKLLFLKYILLRNDPSSSIPDFGMGSLVENNPAIPNAKIQPFMFGLVTPDKLYNELTSSATLGVFTESLHPLASETIALGGQLLPYQTREMDKITFAASNPLLTFIPSGQSLPQTTGRRLSSLWHESDYEIDDLQFIDLPTKRTGVTINKGEKLTSISNWNEEREYGE